tara:strand:+ start:1523 stop:1747 length:225 start_codon:yes stop_codon:yes gene_type:complete
MTTKKIIEHECSKCKLVKPSNLKFFSKEPRNKTGWRGICKQCVNISINSRWRSFNPIIDKRGSENFVLIKKNYK